MSTRGLLIGSGIFAALVFVSDAAQAQEGRWTATSLVAAPSARALHTAIWTGSRMIIWGGDGPGGLNTGAAYDPATDTWSPTSMANAPSARDGHTAVWTGAKMIVWGGDGGGASYLNTGGAYDPITGAWTPISTADAPSARYGHTAVWTGSLMVVWGGVEANGNKLDTGAAYDPSTDTWTPISTTDAPSARFGHTAVWTGSRMVVWGGYGTSLVNTGAAYDPATDTWTPTSVANAPSGRYAHRAVWTGAKMIVWGGWGGANSGELASGGIYDPGTDEWTPTATVNAPSARIGHTAVWTRSRMIVWGGGDDVDDYNSGGAYDPATDTWTPTNTVGAPHARGGHSAVWTGLKMIVWGGTYGSDLSTGGLYDPLQAQSFFTVTPCRLVDTRKPPGPLGGPALAADTTREFVVQGHCGIPPTALAVSVNVMATQQTAQGHLRLYPGGTTPPSTSSLNYNPGQTRASNAIVSLGPQGDIAIRCVQPSGSAHVVVDVNGYLQ